MKNNTRFLTLLLTLLLVFSISVAASAAAPDADDKAVDEIILLEGSGDPSTSVESENLDADNPAVQGETPDEPEALDGDGAAPRKSGNTPYFVGAGIAVLLFAGVAIYCKTNGNKSF